MQPQRRGDAEEDAEKRICERDLGLWSWSGALPYVALRGLGRILASFIALDVSMCPRMSHPTPTLPPRLWRENRGVDQESSRAGDEFERHGESPLGGDVANPNLYLTIGGFATN